MKKNNHKKILISFVSIILITALSIFIHSVIIKTNKPVLKSRTFEISDSKFEVVNKIEETNKEEKEDPLKKNNIFLNVLGKEYSTSLKDGDTVYDVMNRLKDNGDFTFNGKNHSGLGFFVEGINEVNQGNGKYWIYYVNNVEAQVGISNYVLKKGDIISWKLE